MKLNALERIVFAAAYVAEFNRLHDAGVHAQFRADADSGKIKNKDIVRLWEAWCADLGLDAAKSSVNLLRAAQKRATQRE